MRLERFADIPCGALIVQETPYAAVVFDDLNMHFCDRCLLWLGEKNDAVFCKRFGYFFSVYLASNGGD